MRARLLASTVPCMRVFESPVLASTHARIMQMPLHHVCTAEICAMLAVAIASFIRPWTASLTSPFVLLLEDIYIICSSMSTYPTYLSPISSLR